MRKPGEVNLQETNLKIAAENKALREAKADMEAKVTEVLDEYDSLRKAYDALDERWAQTLYPALSKLWSSTPVQGRDVSKTLANPGPRTLAAPRVCVCVCVCVFVGVDMIKLPKP